MRTYLEIEPVFRKKYIDSFIKKFPELSTEEFILTEKIDGTNVRLCFQLDGTLLLGSRNHVLEAKKDHFGLREVLKEPVYKDLLHYLERKVVESGKEIMLVGELFGEGINNRIIYGKRQIRFFDIYIEDLIRPQKEFFEFMSEFPTLCVPIIGKAHGLGNALKYPEIFQSKISTGLAEGLVIKPYSKNYRQGGSIFYLKHKNPDFEERPTRKPHKKAPPNPLLNYISKNRVLDMFSKMGTITSKDQMGKYVNLIRDDALSDFKKDNPTIELNKQQIKAVNGNISRILLEFI